MKLRLEGSYDEINEKLKNINLYQIIDIKNEVENQLYINYKESCFELFNNLIDSRVNEGDLFITGREVNNDEVIVHFSSYDKPYSSLLIKKVEDMKDIESEESLLLNYETLHLSPIFKNNKSIINRRQTRL